MNSKDHSLVQCMELTCGSCGHLMRIARYHQDAGLKDLVEDYRCNLHYLHCPECKNKYEDPSVEIVIDKVLSSTDLSLVHCVELTCPECGHLIRVARCRAPLDAEHMIKLFHHDIQLDYYCLRCPKCKNKYDIESIAIVTRPVEVVQLRQKQREERFQEDDV